MADTIDKARGTRLRRRLKESGLRQVGRSKVTFSSFLRMIAYEGFYPEDLAGFTEYLRKGSGSRTPLPQREPRQLDLFSEDLFSGTAPRLQGTA